MRQVSLTQGKIALVSDKDWALVRKYKWYAVRTNPRGKLYVCSHPTGQSPVYLHRLVTRGRLDEVDHRNGDGLDNRRCNLRRCTRTLNMGNRGPTRANTSGYKGVFRKRKMWLSRIVFRGRPIHLGHFKTKREASVAYAKAAKRYYKQFARIQ